MERTALPRSRSHASASWGRFPGLGSQQTAREVWQFGLVLLGIAFLTFVLYLYVVPNSEMSAARAHIADLQQEHAMLHRQNAELRKEMARYMDLNILERRARRLGMGPPQQAVYLFRPDTIPAEPGTPGQGQSDTLAPSLADQGKRPWEEWLPATPTLEQLNTMARQIVDWLRQLGPTDQS